MDILITCVIIEHTHLWYAHNLEVDLKSPCTGVTDGC